MDDQIYRQTAIDEWKNDFKGYINALNMPKDDYNGIMEYIDELPSVQPDLTYIIFETLAECGLYGEEATIKLIGTLKRLGRNDLLPSCVR